MDKRYKPLTPLEQLEARRRLLQEIADNPSQPIPEVIRHIRTTLRLTIADYARLCGVSARALQDIERNQASPTLATIEKLLKPMALKLAVVSETPANNLH
jgi:XRE family transcriptional regulator, regulator of sulfur utilization